MSNWIEPGEKRQYSSLQRRSDWSPAALSTDDHSLLKERDKWSFQGGSATVTIDYQSSVAANSVKLFIVSERSGNRGASWLPPCGWKWVSCRWARLEVVTHGSNRKPNLSFKSPLIQDQWKNKLLNIIVMDVMAQCWHYEPVLINTHYVIETQLRNIKTQTTNKLCLLWRFFIVMYFVWVVQTSLLGLNSDWGFVSLENKRWKQSDTNGHIRSCNDFSLC